MSNFFSRNKKNGIRTAFVQFADALTVCFTEDDETPSSLDDMNERARAFYAADDDNMEAALPVHHVKDSNQQDTEKQSVQFHFLA